MGLLCSESSTVRGLQFCNNCTESAASSAKKGVSGTVVRASENWYKVVLVKNEGSKLVQVGKKLFQLCLLSTSILSTVHQLSVLSTNHNN